MPSCEKCWADSYDPYSWEDRYERYQELLKKRAANPCSPKEQAGEWWDEKRQCDKRTIKPEGEK